MQKVAIMESVASLLKDMRRTRCLTLGQVAIKSGINKATLSRWETGTYSPSVPELTNVLDALAASSTERTSIFSRLAKPRSVVAVRYGDKTAPVGVALGDLLYGLRQRIGKSQKTVAGEVGVSRSLIAHYERGSAYPDAAQLHALGFALDATEDELGYLSTATFDTLPLQDDRDTILDAFAHSFTWETGATREGRKLELLAYMGHIGRLVRLGKANFADLAGVLSAFGTWARWWGDNPELRRTYHLRALKLVGDAPVPRAGNLCEAVTVLLEDKVGLSSPTVRVEKTMEWLPRFSDPNEQSYLYLASARVIAPYNATKAITLMETACRLVENDPILYGYRLRNMGNLLYLCRKWEQSVAHFATIPTPTPFHAGLRDLGMARSLVKLGAITEARTLLASGKQHIGTMPYAYVRDLIGTIETALN